MLVSFYYLLISGEYGDWEVVASNKIHDRRDSTTLASYITNDGFKLFDIQMMVSKDGFFVLDLPAFFKSSGYRVRKVSLGTVGCGEEKYFALNGEKIIKYPGGEGVTLTDVNIHIHVGESVVFYHDDGKRMRRYSLSLLRGPAAIARVGSDGYKELLDTIGSTGLIVMVPNPVLDQISKLDPPPRPSEDEYAALSEISHTHKDQFDNNVAKKRAKRKWSQCQKKQKK